MLPLQLQKILHLEASLTISAYVCMYVKVYAYDMYIHEYVKLVCPPEYTYETYNVLGQQVIYHVRYLSREYNSTLFDL